MKRVWKKAACVLLAAVLAGIPVIPAFAAENPASPSLDFVDSDIQAVVDDYVAGHADTTAAVSVSVFAGSDVLFTGYYGYTDIENRVANGEDAVFEWGSCSKLLVWTSVMQLYEQGLIDLNADIAAYLPDGFFTKLQYDAPITMYNLMNHNAGWQEVPVELFVSDADVVKTLGDALKATEPAQIYEPGAVTAYSNWGAALAGYIVERISGMPFYEYVHQNIFKPLGMAHTALAADLSDNEWVQQKRPELACYTAEMAPLDDAFFYIPLYPAGMATGTLSDFRRFAQALTADESGQSPLFKNAETLAELYTPTLYYPDGVTARNCHGFWAESDGAIGHGGNTVGCSSTLLFDPATGNGAVVMTNQSSEFVYNYNLMELILGETDGSYDGEMPEASSITGLYRCARTDTKGVLKLYSLFNIFPLVEKSDGSLGVPMTDIALEPIAPTVYRLSYKDASIPMYAAVSDDGRVQSLSMQTADYLRMGWGELILWGITLLFFAVALVYCLVVLICMLIRRIRKKPQPLGVLRGVTCAAVVAAAVNMFVLLITAISYAATLTTITVQAILFALFALIPVAFVIVYLAKHKSLDAARKLKARLITTCVMGLFMTFTVIYWQLWMFWI